MYGLCGFGKCAEEAEVVLRFEPLGKADAEIGLRKAVPACARHVAVMAGEIEEED